MQESQVQSLGQDPLEKGMATHSSILAWRIHGHQRSLAGYSLLGRKELDTTERLSLLQHYYLKQQTLLRFHNFLNALIF